MKITKLEHSGMIVEENGALLVCDPVEFDREIPELTMVEAVVITHGHSDHYQSTVLEKILQSNPDARVFTAVDVEIDGAEKVVHGDVRELPNFQLEFFGENHAEIVPGNYICQNIGVVINDRLINPGDSFDLPESTGENKLLLVANSAPWLRIVESMDFVRRALPKVVIPFHDALNSPFGNQVANNWLQKACDECGTSLKVLQVGESFEV